MAQMMKILRREAGQEVSPQAFSFQQDPPDPLGPLLGLDPGLVTKLEGPLGEQS